jgi:tetratricopeptide (TPR) repeat protein
MELLEGETLAARIRRDGALPRPLADDVVRQLIGGLSAAHRTGVLHRDFKTANVMLCQGADGVRAIITDFGIARPLADGSTEGDGLMTPSYASPEQLAQHRETPATDIFAFGAVLHEIAVGKPAFIGPDRSALPAPRRIRPELDRRWEIVILRCLDPDPAGRYQSFAAVADALEFRRATSRRVLVAGGAAIVAAVASGTGWWFRRQRGTALPSLAVLPFETASENDREMGGALADRLTDLLTRVPGLRVLSGPRAAKLQDADAVQHVLRGRLRDSGDRVEVHLELTVAATNVVSWSRTQAGDALEIEGLYRDAVRSIVDALNLDKESAGVIPSSAGTSNAVAYQKYLLARYHSAQRDAPSVERGIALLEQAIALDDRFSSAWAWLGMCYWLLFADDRPDRALLLSKADATAMRALALNASEADAHTVIGLNNQCRDWNWGGAIWHFRRASALRPGDALAHHRYASVLSVLRRHEEAIAEEELAVRLDPDAPVIQVGQGIVLTAAGHTQEAIAVLKAAAGADPGQANVYQPLSDAYAAAGRLNDALGAAIEAVRRTGGKSFALNQEGYVRARLGQNARARAIAAELENRYRHGLADPYMVASVYAGWHDAASTLDWLERGIAVRDIGLSQLLIDRNLVFLHDTPRWNKLLETVGLSSYAR